MAGVAKLEDIVREMRSLRGEQMIDDSEGPYSPTVEAVSVGVVYELADRIELASSSLEAENTMLRAALEEIMDSLEKEYGWNGTWVDCGVDRFGDEPFLHDTDCTDEEVKKCGSPYMGGCTACKCWHAAYNALKSKKGVE